jgi:hypothetical protein
MKRALLTLAFAALVAGCGGKDSCFDRYGTSYLCICTGAPFPDGGKNQTSKMICGENNSDAVAKAGSGCTCTVRDDTGRCVIEQGRTCR